LTIILTNSTTKIHQNSILASSGQWIALAKLFLDDRITIVNSQD